MDSTVCLQGPEAHHLLHVMRAKQGTFVTVFDGRGAEFLAKVDSTDRRNVVVRIVERRDVDCELDFAITVGCALPKGDRQRFLVEKLVELGVKRLVPLQTERSVARVNKSVCERLRRTVIEASKQCRRNRLLEVTGAVSLAEFLNSFRSVDATDIRWLAHPDGTSLSDARCEQSHATNEQRDVVFAVGPEGGFSAGEIVAAEQSGWRVVSLGPRILRSETAAVSLAAKFALD